MKGLLWYHDKDELLANFSHRQREAYMTSATDDEKEKYTTLRKEFEQIQVNVLPEGAINKTHPPEKEWCDQLLGNLGRFKCLRPMPETVHMEGDDALTIEDKPGLMHAKAEQDRKKNKFSWLTLVSQPVVKFKNRYCMLADY